MCIYNRLKKIHQCVREEENACQILAAVAVHALSRSFDVAVESKRGVNLDEMFNELSRDEKKLKKTKKRKKQQRGEKKPTKDDDDDAFSCEPEPVPEKCNCNDDDDQDHSEDEEQLHSDENDEDKIVLCDGTVIDVGLAPSRANSNSKPSTPAKKRQLTQLADDRSRSTSVEHLEVKVDEVSITSCQSCHENEGICAQQSIDAGYLSETHHEGLQSNAASSRTSSIVR